MCLNPLIFADRLPILAHAGSAAHVFSLMTLGGASAQRNKPLA
jgi:hypothetical protein